jgi:hypothetical protein
MCLNLMKNWKRDINNIRRNGSKACITVYKTNKADVDTQEQRVRDNTLLLLSSSGYCTATSIYAPSGKLYTLTAGHCMPLNTNGLYGLINDKKEITTEYFVAIDRRADLLLLSNNRKDGIKVAELTPNIRYIYTITHGGGKPLFKTTGELLELVSTIYAIFPILNPEDKTRCTKEGYEQLGSDCTFTCSLHVSTAKAFPGSSGGPVLNLNGELVGVVSGYDDNDDHFFSYISPLPAIKKLLEGY